MILVDLVGGVVAQCSRIRGMGEGLEVNIRVEEVRDEVECSRIQETKGGLEMTGGVDMRVEEVMVVEIERSPPQGEEDLEVM